MGRRAKTAGMYSQLPYLISSAGRGNGAGWRPSFRMAKTSALRRTAGLSFLLVKGRWTRAALFFSLLCLIAPFAPAANPAAFRSLLVDACVVGGNVFAVGERGALIRSVDSGNNWDSIDLPANAMLTAINFADTRRGWIAGHDGTILLTDDGGISWSEQTLKQEGDISLLDVLAWDTHHAVAVGAFGTFLVSNDTGRTWTPRKVLEEDLHLSRLTRGVGGAFFVAGERGVLLRFADLRATPEPLRPGYEGSFNGVLVLADHSLLAYGLQGHAYRSENDGASWSAIPQLPSVLLSTAVQLRSGTVILAGQARTFLISHDGARTFRRWETKLTTAVAKLLEAPDGTLLAFGEAGATRLAIPVPAPPLTATPSPSP